jgi:hypothetical protein
MGGKAEELFKTPFSKRRSIYGFIDRQFLPPTMRVFDFANPDLHNPQRSETTVPQQALFFMNGPFVVEQARALVAEYPGDRPGLVRKEQGVVSPEAGIHQLYRKVFQREPTKRQVQLGLQFVRSSETSNDDETEKPIPSAWQYGYGEFDETAKKLKSFEPLPYFNGDAWQGGKKWPDERLGWAQLTASGGHAGNDLQHAVIRRWVSPVDGIVSIKSTIKHERAPGDGIRAYIFSSRDGLIGSWVLHNETAEIKNESVEVKRGDTIDFIVSINKTLNNNDFVWMPAIQMVGADAISDANGYVKEWNAKKEFRGQPVPGQKPLNAWEKYAQVLLLSNEFLFVD